MPHTYPRRLPTPPRTSAMARAIRWSSGVCLSTLALAGHTQSLGELVKAARAFDATFLSAQAQFEASQAKVEQAKAGLRPTVGLSGNATWARTDTSATASRQTDSQSLSLAASQPLFRPANRLADEQAQKSLVVAQAQLQQAEQDLVIRTSQAYFDVLAAEDNLAFIKAQKTAVSEQLAAAKRNFEVGASTITDTREAQARFDLVLAQEIAAENDTRVKKLALDQLVGKATTPLRLISGAKLPDTLPADVNAWVSQAQAEHPSLRQARTALEIAQLETQKAETGHQPTLDAVAQYQVGRSPASTGNSTIRSNSASVGLQFNWPLFAGYAVQNRVKETLALEEKARTDLAAAERTVSQATRSAFFGVQSGLGQVRALEAAEASTQSALDANKLGYQVGVRINIDVLNAQSQLFETKAKLAKARYDVLLGGLKLRQASGQLKADDVAAIDALLAR